MNKRIFLAGILLSMICLNAQTSLDIGDIKIYGEEKSEQDSLPEQKDLAIFWRIDDITEFDFTPKFSPQKFRLYTPRQDRAFIALQTGNNRLVDMKIDYNSVWDVSFDSRYKKIEENWSLNNHLLTANTDFGSWQSEFGVSYDNYETDSLDTNIRSISLGLANSEMGEPGGFSMQEIALLTDLKKYEQEDRELRELDLRTDFTMSFESFAGRLELYYLRSALTGAMETGIKKFLLFDVFNIWLGFDEKHVYPSLHLSRHYLLNKDNLLKIFNRPQFNLTSRAEQIRSNTLLDLDMGKVLPKKPIDLNVVFMNNTWFAKSLYYNFEMIEDQENFCRAPDGRYYLIYDDNLVHIAGLELNFPYRDLSFQQNFSFSKYANDTAYRPQYEISSTVRYLKDKFDILVKFNCEIDAENCVRNQLDDIYNLSIYADYQIKPKWYVIAKLNNMLNKPNNLYEGYPDKEFDFSIGTKFTF